MYYSHDINVTRGHVEAAELTESGMWMWRPKSAVLRGKYEGKVRLASLQWRCWLLFNKKSRQRVAFFISTSVPFKKKYICIHNKIQKYLLFFHAQECTKNVLLQNNVSPHVTCSKYHGVVDLQLRVYRHAQCGPNGNVWENLLTAGWFFYYT